MLPKFSLYNMAHTIWYKYHVVEGFEAFNLRTTRLPGMEALPAKDRLAVKVSALSRL